MNIRKRSILALPVLLLATGFAGAQVCDGVSEASSAVLTTVRVASGLDEPVLAISPPGDTSRLFLVEQSGRIRILLNGSLLGTEFIDLSSVISTNGNEEGLLGLAFHPDYETNGWFFVYHTAGNGNSNVVARYTRSTPDTASTGSRVEAISIPHPTYSNHNGGMIAFSPIDGFLYIGPGDGGSGCGPGDLSQDGGDLRGKMLRIDVDALPYSIPTDNPYTTNGSVLDEIWSVGLRNPFRFSFDSLNGDLYIGDVGQDRWEEVNYSPGTSEGEENYGWDLYEGDHCPNPSCGSSTCVLPDHVPPVLEYSNLSEGCSVTGGYVYRGCRMPDLRGTYFYADFCTAFIRTFRIAGGVATALADRTTELDPPGSQSIDSITSFGQDARGEIYVVDRGGEVFQIVPVFTAMTLSGAGATPFEPGTGDWTWEDLEATSPHQVASYRVYRHDGDGSGTFDCVHQSAGTSWSGGDPDVPAAGALFSYLTTAISTSGDETDPGKGTGGAPRSLSTGPCPQ